MSIKIIQLSDLHIGYWLEFPTKETEENNLKKIVDKICTNFQEDRVKPIILITGDLINDGTPQQYRAVKKLFEPLYKDGFVVWPVPGNHDYGRLGNHAVKRRFKYFKKAFFGSDNPHFPLEHVVYPQPKKLNGHWFIGLNSMKGELGYLDSWLADGELGKKQIHNTLGILRDLSKRSDDEKKNEKVILFLHHHPFIFPHDLQSFIGRNTEKAVHYLKDGEDFMNKISGLVDVLLFGHDHDHINFSNTKLSEKYNIPFIFSCVKSTEPSQEQKVNNDNLGQNPTKIGEKGLLGWEIEIQNNGNVMTKSICF